jgi:hypothetical protein
VALKSLQKYQPEVAGLIAETEKQSTELRLTVIREESPKAETKERKVRFDDDEDSENTF